MTSKAPHPSELIYNNITELIGDTPLVELNRIGRHQPRARIYGKLESANPGGSVKDRIGLQMILAAEKSGQLKPNGVIIEPTSGNTGIALALVARTRGYRCVLTMPESMSLERRQLLEAYGAEIVLTAAEDQMTGAVNKANELGLEIENSFLPHQFDNPENPKIHSQGTAEEIIFSLDGLVPSAFVASVGTGGTISGVGRRLKEVYPDCKIIAVEPESCATISRGEVGPSKIQGIAAGFIPKNYDASVVDEVLTVSDQEAYDMKQSVGKSEGMLIGLSAGANLEAAVKVAQKLPEDALVISLICDTGERYFSLDEFFQEKK